MRSWPRASRLQLQRRVGRGPLPRGSRMESGKPGSSMRTAARSSLMRAARFAGLVMMCAAVIFPGASTAQPPSTALPPPPYLPFAGQTFEPSAAAFDPVTGHVLVLSDKDVNLYRYELSAAGLVLPRGEHHYPLRLPEGLGV